MDTMLGKVAGAAVAAALLLSGAACGGGGEAAQEAQATTTTTVATVGTTNTVAQSRASTLAVYAGPAASGGTRTLSAPAPGAPLVVLVLDRQGDWLRVSLPVRPNGSTGWVRADDVTLSEHDYRIEVSLSGHRLRVFEGGRVVMDEPAAVGKPATPTPTGRFYTLDLLKPPNPGGDYGPFAYVLSAFSDTLTDFAGGTGEVGIHGTNQPSSLGKDASHGCIRVSNAAVTAMAELLPLGVPVDITA